MKRPELVNACSEKFGPHNWLGASNEELQKCLDTGAVPTFWSSGRGSARDAMMPKPDAVPAPPPTPSPTPSPSPATPEPDGILGPLVGYIRDQIKVAAVDPESVKAIVDEAIEKAIAGRKPTEVLIKVGDNPGVKVGNPHKNLAKLVTYLAAGVHVMLVGPAGSGKTMGAEQAAEALGLEFTPVSVGPQTSKSDLLGYMDANGRYIPSLFRKVYENGGLLLMDEVDSGNASVLTITNAAISNGYCSFPDGVIKRHETFKLVAAANTFGRGADRVYVGRAQLDAATLNRFVVITWDYDEDMERAIAGNDAWVAKVQAWRDSASKLGIRHIISPRASIFGARLLAAGVKQSEVEADVVWAGLDEASVKKIKAQAA